MAAIKTTGITQFSFGILGPSSVGDNLRFTHDQADATIKRTDIAPARGFCAICGEDFPTCPGHVSFISLPENSRYILPIGMTFIKSILDLICLIPKCQNFCMLKTTQRAPTFEMLKAVMSKQKCRMCDVKQEVKLKKNGRFEFEVKNDGNTRVFDMITAMNCFHEFMDKTETWAQTLHVSPSVRDLVTSYVHLIGYRHRMPMTNRASHHNVQTGNPFTDQITKVFAMFSGKKSALIDIRSRPHDTSREMTKNLAQLSVSTSTSRNRSAANQTPMCVSTAVKGKPGIIRKRLTARSVCGMFRMVAASQGSLTEGPTSISTVHVGLPVGIPFMIVEEVSACNYDNCLAIFETDQLAHLRRIVDGTIITPSRKRSGALPKLQVGDFLVRQHRTGDVMTFNRQPTLHKQSIQGFVIHVNPEHTEYTARVPAIVTSAFNADFDGDEMSGTSHNSTEAKIETCLVTEVAGNIYKEGTGSPVVAVLYNGILGIYRACQLSGFNVSDSDYDFIVTRVAPRHADSINDRCRLFGIDAKSIKGVISLAFPPWLSYDRADVSVRNGVLLKGLLTKADLGTVSRGIVHTLCVNGNIQDAMFFINAMQMLGEWFTDRFVATIRHEDNLIDRESIEEISKMVDAAIALKPNQQECSEIFNIIQLRARKLATNKIAPNMGNMTNSGAKGSAASIAQNFGPLGAQPGHMQVFADPLFLGSLDKPDSVNLDGKRVRRTSHYDSESCHPGGFGIIFENFTRGVTFSSMAFLAANCRAGLAAKTISTATAGSHQRDLARGNEATISGFNGAIVHGAVTIAPNPIDAQCGISIKDARNIDVPFDIQKEMKLILSKDINVNVDSGDITLGSKKVGSVEINGEFVNVNIDSSFRKNGFASLALADLSTKMPVMKFKGNHPALKKLCFVRESEDIWRFTL